MGEGKAGEGERGEGREGKAGEREGGRGEGKALGRRGRLGRGVGEGGGAGREGEAVAGGGGRGGEGSGGEWGEWGQRELWQRGGSFFTVRKAASPEGGKEVRGSLGKLQQTHPSPLCSPPRVISFVMIHLNL